MLSLLTIRFQLLLLLVISSPLLLSASLIKNDPITTNVNTGRTPSWDELDKRIPNWYDEVKFGIFIHWGVFSVPSYKSEWFWEYWMADPVKGDVAKFVHQTERPGFSYTEYASRFKAEFYNPKEWVEIFEQSGAQYVVLTSKHHEGYCMWNSTNIPTTWNWNVMDVGPRRDVLGELATEVKQSMSPYTHQPLKFGVYHSLYEWYNPLYLFDKANNFTTQQFVDTKTLPELYDLVTKYEPELIWSDGEWEANSTYWKSREFLDWYSTESPVHETASWNDRWGTDVLCRHGTFLTCDDRYNPQQLQTKKFEDCFTIDKGSWGYNRDSLYNDYLTTQELIHTIIKVVAYNGNVLINVGPSADGTIHPIFVDRLLGIGKWFSVNGDAIYKTRPWDVCQNETDVFYTKRDSDNVLYAHITRWPENKDNLLHLACPVAIPNKTIIHFLGLDSDGDEGTELSWSQNHNHIDNDVSRRTTRSTTEGLFITLPMLTPNTIPCEHAWVIAINNIANLNPSQQIDKIKRGSLQ